MQLSRSLRGVRTAAVRRVAVARVVKVRAETTEKTAEPATETPAAPAKRRNSTAFTGYVAEDTYGQTNIFPVEVGIVEIGSAKDVAEDNGANTAVAGVAFAVAAAVIIGGVFATSKAPTTSGVAAVEEEFSQYLAVSQYSAKFAAEYAAPAVAAE